MNKSLTLHNIDTYIYMKYVVKKAQSPFLILYTVLIFIKQNNNKYAYNKLIIGY